MVYEVKVNELAEEFGVHRNTIRNWINSGTLPAQKAPGRRYLVQEDDYLRLCEKFSRKPRVHGAKRTESPTQEHPFVPEKATPKVQLSLTSDLNLAISTESCTTCGSCASACPLTGVDGLDPRKIVRMAALGLSKDILETDWPWKCTLCGRCEESCPMNIDIVLLMERLRALRKPHKIPHLIQKGITTSLRTGNNLGIQKADFVELLTTLGENLAKTSCPGFTTPVDVRGARLLVTVNSKEPYVSPEDMTWWWRIFYCAGESWTIPSENWDGVNWALYSGDEAALKTIVERIVDNLERLNCEALLLPECGHAYYATRYGLEKWFPEVLQKYKIYTVFDLLVEYLHTSKITLDTTAHSKRAALHDSCHYGRKSLKQFGHGYFAEGRQIMQSCCSEVVELTPNRRDNYCCGAGGGSLATPYAAERIYHGREKARQVQQAKAELLVVPCHSCKDQLKHSLIREFDLDIEVKFLWQLVAEALVLPETV
ncbi:MAG: Fe-S oxidoreductase [Desulfobulbus propionicus]|nr:MAG: Fe-S oxidoreductase [Desulfobulbus propionicus]